MPSVMARLVCALIVAGCGTAADIEGLGGVDGGPPADAADTGDAADSADAADAADAADDADVVDPAPPATLVLGHRGVAWNHEGNPYPENTMLSIRAAIAQGADGVEVDLVKTADDVFVLRHDDRLSTPSVDDGRPRTSCDGRLTQYTWDALSDCRAWSHAEDGLDSALDRVETLLAEPGLGLLVLDVKNDGLHIEGERSVELLIALIEAAGVGERVLLMLYTPEAIAIGAAAGLATCLKRHNREGATADEMTAAVLETEASGSCANASLVDGDFMGSLRDAGLSQTTFLLRDDPGDGFDAAFGRLVEVGADGVITDLVAEAVRVRAAAGRARAAGAPSTDE